MKTPNTPDDLARAARTSRAVTADIALLAIVPRLFAALEEIARLNRETTTFSDNRDEIDRITREAISLARHGY